MTKSIKIIIIATIVTCAILISCACAMPANAEELAPAYGRFAIVVEVDLAEDTVTCMDTDGNLWSFYGIDTWTIGDLCTLTFWNNSEEIAEYEITDVRFEGWMDPQDFEKIFQI